jgi:hypothetical protein
LVTLARIFVTLVRILVAVARILVALARILVAVVFSQDVGHHLRQRRNRKQDPRECVQVGVKEI